MAGASFKLQGMQGFKLALEQLPTTVYAAVGSACQQTALAVQQRARQFAPRDKGDLAAAIRVEGRGAHWRVGVAGDDVLSRTGRNAAHRHPSTYGVWYEFGFTTRKILKHPFMGPAADAEEGPHEDRLRIAASRIERSPTSRFV